MTCYQSGFLDSAAQQLQKPSNGVYLVIAGLLLQQQADRAGFVREPLHGALFAWQDTFAWLEVLSTPAMPKLQDPQGRQRRQKRERLLSFLKGLRRAGCFTGLLLQRGPFDQGFDISSSFVSEVRMRPGSYCAFATLEGARSPSGVRHVPRYLVRRRLSGGARRRSKASCCAAAHTAVQAPMACTDSDCFLPDGGLPGMDLPRTPYALFPPPSRAHDRFRQSLHALDLPRGPAGREPEEPEEPEEAEEPL